MAKHKVTLDEAQELLGQAAIKFCIETRGCIAASPYHTTAQRKNPGSVTFDMHDIIVQFTEYLLDNG